MAAPSHAFCRFVVDGKVYDATPFLKEHPGVTAGGRINGCLATGDVWCACRLVVDCVKQDPGRCVLPHCSCCSHCSFPRVQAAPTPSCWWQEPTPRMNSTPSTRRRRRRCCWITTLVGGFQAYCVRLELLLWRGTCMHCLCIALPLAPPAGMQHAFHHPPHPFPAPPCR